jgi:hypothetical protein
MFVACHVYGIVVQEGIQLFASGSVRVDTFSGSNQEKHPAAVIALAS